MSENPDPAVAKAEQISRTHGVAIRRENHGHAIGLVDMKRILIRLGLVHRFDPDIDTIARHISV